MNISASEPGRLRLGRSGRGEVVVTRGGVAESRHEVAFEVVDAAGSRMAGASDEDEPVYYRSAAKPLQALPLVEDGVVERFGLTEEELALCCASHNAEERHLEVGGSILAKAGAGERDLACGPHAPMGAEAAERLARSGEAPTRLHNNCSGKHAGMLALARAHGWRPEGYHLAEHPVQRRMLAEVSRWTGVDAERIRTGVDGCGVVCFAVPLRAMALSFARFAQAAARGEAPARVVAAMTRHPHMVAGTGRLCTAVMRHAGARVFVKTGAEGVYCAGVPAEGLGIALKVEDGARRAADVALLGILGELGVLDGEAREALEPLRAPGVTNTRGERVGEMRMSFGTKGLR